MKTSKWMMLIGASLLAGLFIWPLWNITLEAPQYPDPIGMDIHINRFEDMNPNDIQNINIMNHYVGMKDIPESIPEFRFFPIVAGSMMVLGMVFGLIGNRKLYLVWLGLMVILGVLAFYDFYLWEYDYGHNLKENAAIKFTDKDGQPMAYQPPLIGAKDILNFKAISMPRFGAYLMFGGMLLSLLAFFKSQKEELLKPLTVSLMLFMLLSCSSDKQPIHYGQDACAFCKMTIVDRSHAAQLVTDTGKNYKYDAVECMMNDLKSWEGRRVRNLWVSDYGNPGQMTDAKSAGYLISKGIPSPMGMNITAFQSLPYRDKMQSEKSGRVLDWTHLQEEFELNHNSHLVTQ
ncbi:MAG: nitrous oxide reductase accessory protein NosL [Cytophagales bacterium]|nr:nitrous oxide reductase accessory protein NosL [Cytophagales bacterium]